MSYRTVRISSTMNHVLRAVAGYSVARSAYHTYHLPDVDRSGENILTTHKVFHFPLCASFSILLFPYKLYYDLLRVEHACRDIPVPNDLTMNSIDKLYFR